jgi:hypothetical protein
MSVALLYEFSRNGMIHTYDRVETSYHAGKLSLRNMDLTAWTTFP